MTLPDPQAVASAVQSYFRGERLEMYCILAGSLLAILACAALYLVGRDGFARGFGVVVLATVVLFGGTAAGLLWRDPQREAELLAASQGPQAVQAVSAEAARIQTVIAQYPLYRYAGVALVVLGLLLVLFTRQPVWHGVAAGLGLTFVALLVIDHYSSERAVAYSRQLAKFTA